MNPEMNWKTYKDIKTNIIQNISVEIVSYIFDICSVAWGAASRISSKQA